MRGLVEELRGTLTWFAQEQREHFAMVVSYEDEDAGMIHAVLHGLDQSDPGTLYLTFAHEAKTERAYVDVMIELMGTRREAVNAERAARGSDPVPPPPAECLDASRTASERIQRVLRWWRASLQDPEQLVVLSLLPGALPKPEFYRQIVSGLLPAGMLDPWTRNTRLIVRDRRVEPFLGPILSELPAEASVATTVDFSPKACEEGLAADAANTRLAPRDRALAMLQLAGLDYAHQRLPAAMEKYGHLANVFSELGEPALVALCLCGAGDVHQRAGQLPQARQRYLSGVETGGAAKAKPVVLNCLLGLGQTTYSMGRYDESEAAWDAAARVAGSLGNPYGVADAVEQVGVCRLARQRVNEALVAWERALELIAEHPYGHREASILERMTELASRERWGEQEQRYRARLAVAKRNEAQQGGAA